jgi:hypothetical protein
MLLARGQIECPDFLAASMWESVFSPIARHYGEWLCQRCRQATQTSDPIARGGETLRRTSPGGALIRVEPAGDGTLSSATR